MVVDGNPCCGFQCLVPNQPSRLFAMPFPPPYKPTTIPIPAIEKIAINFNTKNPIATRAPVMVPKQFTSVINHTASSAVTVSIHPPAQPSGNTIPFTCFAKIKDIILIEQGRAIEIQVHENMNPEKSL